MTDKRYIPLKHVDVATRMNLIFKVHGIEQVERYFNNLPQVLKGFEVYTALLNCYANGKSVEKAEAVMQQLRDTGSARTALCYNILMNLYYRIGRLEKLDSLMHEMEGRGINCDSYTFTIRLSAYAAASDSEGVDKIVARMESDPGVVLDWKTGSIVAKAYLKVGLVEKAFVMLNKLEGLMATASRRNLALDTLLNLYAETGEKDELYRIWNEYKTKIKIYNKGYISMMSSLLTCNDIEGAEKIFKEWESSGLSFDFRIPNILIDGYCKSGLLEKAEALLKKGISKGVNPSSNTWYYLAGAYIEHNQVPKALEALRKALLVCSPNWKPPYKDILATCLKFLERQANVDEAEEFMRVLKKERIFSAAVHDKLSVLVKEGTSQT